MYIFQIFIKSARKFMVRFELVHASYEPKASGKNKVLSRFNVNRALSDMDTTNLIYE